MESKIKSSFIPDNMPRENAGTGVGSIRGGDSADVFVVLAVVIFAASLSLSAGVFLYDKFLTANAQAKSEQLQRERKLLEPATIRELMRLDKRLNVSQDILSAHIAPSALFALLENITLKSVYFENLEYAFNENKGISIKMRGKARSVNGVALQSELFGKNRAIINPIFSNLNLVKDGVQFDVSASVDPTALNFASVATYEEGSDFGSDNNF